MYCKMGDFSDFQRVHIVCPPLPGASATKMRTSLSVSSAAASKILMSYTNDGKTSSAEKNSDRNAKPN